MQSKRFISVSRDGTICIWCSKDGSCVKKIKNIVKPGALHLSLHPTHTSLIWVWNIGIGSYLVDITQNNIILSLDLPGLKSFSFMSPKNTIFVKEDSIVAVLNNSQKIFSINEKNEITNIKSQKITKHNESDNFNFVVTQYGLVKIKRKTFSIIFKGEKDLATPNWNI